MRSIDRYGRSWNLPDVELCPECGQPDSCGDCNHAKLLDDEVLQLGGVLSQKDERDDAIGRALALELGLLRNTSGRYDLANGDKTLRGLTRTLRRIIEEGTA